jgi:hypothetical protein
MVDITRPVIKENVTKFVERAMLEWKIPETYRQHLEDDFKNTASIAIKIEENSSAKLNGLKKAVHNKILLRINKSIDQYRKQNVGKINEDNLFGFETFIDVQYDPISDNDFEYINEYYFKAREDEINIISSLKELQIKLEEIVNSDLHGGRKANQVRRFTTDRLLRIYQHFNEFKSQTDPEKSHSEKIMDPVTKFIDDFMCLFTPGSVDQNITDHAKADYVSVRARILMETTDKKHPI